MICGNSTRDNDFKLKVHGFRVDIRKRNFMMMLVRLKNQLLRKAVYSTSLEMFKARLVGALNNLE